MKRYVDVILPLPLEGFFTYAVPERLAEKVKRGVRVLVPLGKSKRYVGLAVEVHDRKPDFAQIKEVMEVLDAEPVVREEQFRLWQWIADYYLSPIGEVYNAAFPRNTATNRPCISHWMCWLVLPSSRRCSSTTCSCPVGIVLRSVE